MKATELMEKSTPELNEQIRELKAELFNLRFQLATGQLQNTMAIAECKRNIARAKTIVRDRELKKAQG